MIAGVGVDMVSVRRIERAYRRRPERFWKRIFTAAEREALLRRQGSFYQSLAARYAGKEAVLKAIGCGIGPAGLNEVEIQTFRDSAPRVTLHGEAARLASAQGIAAIFLSLTHESPFACAFAVAVT